MNIQSIISSASYTNYVKNTTSKVISISKDTFKQALASGDILTLGSDDDSIYSTNTRPGVYSDKASIVEANNAVSENTELTDDEKWDVITSKYRSPIFQYDDYMNMLDDLEGAGLITADEKAVAMSHATAVIEKKRYNYDMQDGKLGDDRIPAPVNTIYFDELISDLSNENREIPSTDDGSDPRVFLEALYNKAKGAEMTKDEKWEAVTSHYNGKPMTEHDYNQMLCDLENADLITFKERCAASGHSMSVVYDKVTNYDLQDGIIGNGRIPASLYLIDFDELFADLSNENRIYEGYTEENDPRPFLHTFYQKISGYFPKEAAGSVE